MKAVSAEQRTLAAFLLRYVYVRCQTRHVRFMRSGALGAIFVKN